MPGPAPTALLLAAGRSDGLGWNNAWGASLALGLLFLVIWLAERMPTRPRRVLLTLSGLLVGAVAYDLARFDQGLGWALAFVGLIAAPLLVIFGVAAWAVRRFYGWPDLGEGPPRAAYICLFVLAGMLLGMQRQVVDVRATQVLADEVAFDAGRPAWQLPRTRLGWWDPPRLRRGQDTEGRLVVGFPLSGEGHLTTWMWRVQGETRWRQGAGPDVPAVTWDETRP